jgi:hypothetical protein
MIPRIHSARRAAAATLAALLLLAGQQTHSSDVERSAWRHASEHAQSSDQITRRHHPPRHKCLARDAFAERLEFASVRHGKEILGRPDPWARQLSDFDRGARQRTLAPTSTKQFLQFASSAARGWTATEKAEWTVLARRLSAAAKGLNVKLPRIHLVKTSGAEEFDSAYTRGRSIMLPQRLASLPSSNPREAFFLLAHELFHVLSRSNPSQRESLYTLLDFERVAGFDYPAELEATRLSNPDAFAYEHALTVQTPSGMAAVLPVNQSTVPLAEAIQLPSIFAALDIVLLAVDTDTGDVLRDDGGNLVRFGFGNTDWPPRMLRNSSFIIHPEEVLADNFATLMQERANGFLEPTNPGGFPINDVDLLRDIEDVLTAGCRSKR